MAKKTEKQPAPKKAKASKTKTETAAKPAKAARAKKAAPSADAGKALPRHPKARVIAAHKSKAELAKTLADALARDDEDTDVLAARLEKSSNAQLLRLQHVTETVKQKYGDRGKLIAAIGAAQKKSGDKDYLAKLDTYSLPQLLDLATSSQRGAHA